MSLSEYFKKKSGAILFASTVAVSGLGAYAGLEIVHATSGPKATPSIMTTPTVHPSLSKITVDQQDQGTFEGNKSEATRLKELGADPQRAATIADFKRMIDRMEQDGKELKSVRKEITRIKSRSASLVNETNIADILKEKELRAALETARQQAGIKFIDELRMTENITEVDYNSLIAAFAKRVAITLPEEAGNYRDGVMYQQDCRIMVGMANMWYGDDEKTPRDIGNCMKDFFDNPEKTKAELPPPPPTPPQKSYGMEELAGALSGAAIGTVLTVPFWLRRRRQPGL